MGQIIFLIIIVLSFNLPFFSMANQLNLNCNHSALKIDSKLITERTSYYTVYQLELKEEGVLNYFINVHAIKLTDLKEGKLLVTLNKIKDESRETYTSVFKAEDPGFYSMYNTHFSAVITAHERDGGLQLLVFNKETHEEKANWFFENCLHQ